MNASPEPIVLYGVGTTYAYDVWETLRRLGHEVVLVANVPPGAAPRPTELGPVLDHDALPAGVTALPVLLAPLSPGHRTALVAETAALGFRRFATAVDPTAVVASTATVGEGTHVNAGAVIAAMTRIGRHAVVNRSASVGHHVALDDYVTLGPGCVLCGSICIAAGAFVGAGAVLRPKVQVGRNAVIGAGAVVVTDVAPHTVVAGNPAKVIRTGNPGYNGLAV